MKKTIFMSLTLAAISLSASLAVAHPKCEGIVEMELAIGEDTTAEEFKARRACGDVPLEVIQKYINKHRRK